MMRCRAARPAGTGRKNCGGTSRLTSLYFAFRTRPTISMSARRCRRRLPMRLPTASRPRLNFFANASLTIATFGAPCASARVNSRPASSGMPSVREVSGPDLVVARVRVGVRARLEAFHRDVVAPVARRASSGTSDVGRRRSRRAARASSSSSALEQLPRLLRRVAVQLRRDAEHDHVVGLQPEIDAADVEQALGEQPGRRRAAPSTARSAPSPATCGTAPPTARPTAARLPLQRRHEIGTRAVQRGKQPEQQAGADRERRGEEQHRRIDLERRSVSVASGRQQRAIRSSVHCATTTPPTPPKSASRHDSPSSCAIELPPAGADRQAHRHLAGARGADARAAGSRCSRTRSAARTPVTPSSRMSGAVASRETLLCPRLPGSSDDRLRPEPRHRLLAHALLQRRFDVVDDRVIRRVHRRARLLDRDAGLQAREQVRPVAAAVVEALKPAARTRAS